MFVFSITLDLDSGIDFVSNMAPGNTKYLVGRGGFFNQTMITWNGERLIVS